MNPYRCVIRSRFSPHSLACPCIIITVGVNIDHNMPRDVVQVLFLCSSRPISLDQFARHVDHCDGRYPFPSVCPAVKDNCLRPFANFHHVKRAPFERGSVVDQFDQVGIRPNVVSLPRLVIVECVVLLIVEVSQVSVRSGCVCELLTNIKTLRE